MTGFFHSNIKVHVVEKDITKTQKKVASIRAKATIIGKKIIILHSLKQSFKMVGVIILASVILSILVGLLGSSRKIGFGMAFLWSILLSPLIGVIITMASKPLEDAEMEKQHLELQKEQMKELKNIASKNSVQQIKEAKELLDSGAITEDEFSILKKQIIGDLPKPIIPPPQQKIIVDEPDAVVDTDTSESSNKNAIMLGVFLIIIVFALVFGIIGAFALQ